MKNIHTRLFWLIVLLTIGAIYVIVTKPVRLGLDIQGGMRVVLRAQKEQLSSGKWTQQNLETVAGIIRKRVDALGVAEPVIYTKPNQDQIVVELPGVRDEKEALKSIQTTARLEFRYVPELERDWRSQEETVNGKPTGFEQIIGSNGEPVTPEELEARVFSKPPVLTGAELEPNARAELTPSEGTVIHFEFKGPAKRVFEQFTRSHLNKPLAIFLDKKLISAPNIEDVIPGVGIIRGRFSPDQARALAGQLNAGALPVPLKVEQQQTVEATLGQQAVHSALIAGIIGLVAVAIFMLGYYRLPGALADLALILYTLFTLAIFKGAFGWLGLPGVTLTVPGIAGFILSIGMAVDANVLIFERLKEERHAGKSLRAAIEAGFRRAFTAIFDSNMCTLITCAILYHFGTGPVRGFALTLAVGVIVSMFTAITCSRTFLLMLSSTKLGDRESLYHPGMGAHPKLNVTRHMMMWFGISIAVIVPGVVFLAMGGLKPSIEFTGGTEISAQFPQEPSIPTVRQALASVGFDDPRIVLAEGNRAYVTTRLLDPGEQTRAVKALTDMGGRIESTSVVSGNISRELTSNAVKAVLFASILIVAYLAIRFALGGVMEGLKFGVCAIAATLHDVIGLLGVFAILGYFLHWEIDSLFITALLTVIGFSTHDTIVIFDRIRENLRHRARGETFAEVTDRSIEQTFARSINTSVTVALTLVSLLVFGGPTLRVFVTALLFGVVSGTYSSIFNASPLLVLWKRLAGDRDTVTTGTGGAAPRSAQRPAQPAPRPRPAPQAAGVAPASGPATAPAPAPKPAVSNGGDDSGQRARSKKRKRRM